jgi:hypothetical protein
VFLFLRFKDIEVEFHFKDIGDDDYHGVKALVSQISNGPLSNLTLLTETIVNQCNIGTVVTTGDSDSGIAAFGSILNISQHKKEASIISLNALLKDIAKKNPRVNKILNGLQKAESDMVVGLVLKERLINSPFELGANLHKVLIEDVKWSSSKEYEPEANETRGDYAFTHLLFLSSFEVEGGSRATEVTEGGATVEPEGVGHKKKRKLDKSSALASRVYHHWEDEIFLEKALFSHSWQNTAKSTLVRANRKFQSYSLMYALRWSDYEDLTEKLTQI